MTATQSKARAEKPQADAPKIPTDSRPMVRDPELAAAIELELRPYSGERLARAQEAVRKLRESGLMGTFGEVLAAYQATIREAGSAE